MGNVKQDPVKSAWSARSSRCQIPRLRRGGAVGNAPAGQWVSLQSMRVLKTGTGRGRTIGKAKIAFYAKEARTADGCSVDWEGEDWLPALLPVIAWDLFLPNLRAIGADGVELRGDAAQAYQLDQFESWFADSITAVSSGDPLPLTGVIPVQSNPSGSVVATATLVVRINENDRRLWGEIEYGDKEDSGALFSVIHSVLWDWVATRQSGRPDDERLVAAFLAQFAFYDENRIPADFRLREVGLGPYQARAAEVDRATNVGPTEQETRETAERLGWKPRDEN